MPDPRKYLHSEGTKPEVGVAVVEEDASEVGVEVGGRSEVLATAKSVEVLPKLLRYTQYFLNGTVLQD